MGADDRNVPRFPDSSIANHEAAGLLLGMATPRRFITEKNIERVATWFGTTVTVAAAAISVATIVMALRR
ncbi:hypothetical protein ACSC95_00130 [Burkholderia vietnamiensis]|uniref:hypothetical protein n=1 Tax=Burkholderia vietnamiensis TaxID=60552 RepID=UPI001589BC75|nr:hypothetical protein [Burkholderia vietnamiensis]